MLRLLKVINKLLGSKMIRYLLLVLSVLILTLSFNVSGQTAMSTGTVTLNNGTYTDPNGFSNYANSSNITQTICASSPGQCVTIQFLEFNLEANFDYLRIYNGSTTSPANLIATLTGNYLPTNFTSTSGCLTLIFTSDSNVSSSGWFANILTNPCGTTPTVPPTPISASDAFQAVNICTNPTFLLDPNNSGLITEFTVGSFSNPSTNPASTNSGCLLTGEVNSSWLIVNVASAGTLEFSFGAPSTSTNKCLDWIMWPYNGTSTINQISTNSLAPIRCNWNASCQGFTGIASTLPIGANQGDFEPTMQVSCGQKFIICLSNWNALNTVIPINFFGTAGISCSTVNGLQVNSASICQGQSASLIASGATSYLWSNGVTSPTQTVSPTSTTSYTVTGQSDCGNTTQTATVTVTPIPVVNAGADTTVCAGTVLELNGSGATNYSWNNGVTNSVPFAANQTQTYTVTGSTNGCSNTDQVTINVNPLPNVNAGPDQQLCEGQSTVIIGSGAPTLQWDQGMNSNTSFTPSLGIHTYTLTGTSLNGCTKVDQVQIIVHENPIVNAGNDIVICQGNAVTLNPTGANNYQWTNGATTNTPFIPTFSGIYTVTGTTVFGCTDTDELEITINSLPSINAGTDITVCQGEQITLTGTGATSLNWNYGAINGQAFTPSATTTYTLTGTNPEGCSASDQMTVTVNPLPNPSINGIVNYCSLSSAVLTTNTSFDSYAWSTGSTNSSTNATQANNPITVSVTNSFGCTATSSPFNVVENNLISTFQTITICEGDTVLIHGVSQSTPGVYVNSIFTPLGCDSVSTVTLIVNPAPQVNAGADMNSCAGSNFQLNANSNGTFNWLGGFTNNQSIQPSVGNHQYIVSATSLQGCTNSDTLFVNVFSLPSVFAGNDTSICIGNSISFNATGAISYNWSNGVSNGSTFSPTQTAIYTVTGTDANGCSNNDQLTVTINQLPTVNAGPDQIICDGTQLLLNATGAVNYSWDNGLANGSSFIPATGTSVYTVVGTSSFGCINSDQFEVQVNPLPVVEAGLNQEVCQNTSIVLNATGAVNYTWNNNIGNNQSFNPPVGTTVYSVVGTSSLGCTSSDQLTVLVHPLPQIQAGTDVSICDGESITLSAQGGQNFVWTNGIQDGLSFIPTASGLYTVTGTSSYGCVNSDNLFVTVNPIPTVEAGTDTAICYGESIILSGSGADSYSWNNGVTNNAAFSPNVGTIIYTVVGTTNAGCLNSDSLTLIVKPIPSIQFDADATNGCIPKTINFLNETENTQSCTWKFGSDPSTWNYSDASYTFTEEGCYDITLEVLGTNGCSNSKQFNNFICVEDAPTVSFTPSTEVVNQIDGMVHFFNTTEGATSYSWNFGDNSANTSEENPIHDFNGLPFGNYMVKLIASSSMGCTDSNFVLIKMDEESLFFVPNTFTPDEDALNQIFQPIFTDGFDPFNFSMTIYNRWGERVFETHDASIGWNGSLFNSGEVVQDGMYTWTITYKKVNTAKTDQITGHVNLIR